MIKRWCILILILAGCTGCLRKTWYAYWVAPGFMSRKVREVDTSGTLNQYNEQGKKTGWWIKKANLVPDSATIGLPGLYYTKYQNGQKIKRLVYHINYYDGDKSYSFSNVEIYKNDTSYIRVNYYPSRDTWMEIFGFYRRGDSSETIKIRGPQFYGTPKFR